MKNRICYCLFFLLFLIELEATAQIIGDDNWDPVLLENFTGNRSWGPYWNDNNTSIPGYQSKWMCFAFNSWNDGVTLGHNTHQAFQVENAVFENNLMKLICEWKSDAPLACGIGYVPAPSRYCNSSANEHKAIFYHSGIIESINLFKYGYFEIKCKLPFHPGSFPAFWLFNGGDDSDPYYEEIDIMEYSYGDIGNGTPNRISRGLLYNPHETACPTASYGGSINIPNNGTITQWHTYGCDWQPGRITWYLDGEIIGDYFDMDGVPTHPLRIIANYSLNDYGVQNEYPNQIPFWRGTDNMLIDYIKVYQLKCDCDSYVTITNEYELDNFDQKVKHSVEIGSTNEIQVLNTTDVTIRASDHISITGPFEVPIGAELGMIVHPCPYPEE